MTPLSEQELQALRQLDLKKYSEYPLFHLDEVIHIIRNVMPKLIAVAEDHAKSSKLKPIIPTPQFTSLETSKLQELNNLLDREKMDIQSLKDWIKYYSNHCDRRSELFRSINIIEKLDEPIKYETVELPVLTPPLPWYKRLLKRFI